MLKVTSSRPELIIPWLELGLAQLGLKKYPEAENSFKIALGIDSTSQQRAHSDDFYQQSDSPGAVAPSATRQSRNTMGAIAVDPGRAMPYYFKGQALTSKATIDRSFENQRHRASGLNLLVAAIIL